MKYVSRNTTFNGVEVNDTIDEFSREKYTNEDYKGYFARLVAVGERPYDAQKIGASNERCDAAIAIFSEHEPYRAIYAVPLPEKYGEYEREDGTKTAKFNKPLSEFWEKARNYNIEINENNPFIVDAKFKIKVGNTNVTYNGPVAVTSRWNINDDFKGCVDEKTGKTNLDNVNDVMYKHQNSLICTCLEDNGMFKKGNIIVAEPGGIYDVSVNKVYTGNNKGTKEYLDFVGDVEANRYESISKMRADAKQARHEAYEAEVLRLKRYQREAGLEGRTAFENNDTPYAKITLRDMRDDMASPYYKGYVALVDKPGYRDGEYDEYYRLKNLKTDLADHRLTMGGRDYVNGDWMSVYEDNLFVDEVITKDHPEYAKCQALEKQFDDMHAQAPYEIRGVVYDVTPTYYDWDKDRIHPNYECIEEKTWNPKDVHSLEDCEKWILKNHPDYYMGYSAQQKCPSGDFCCGAIPSAYGREYCETYDARRKYAAERAKNLGVSLGPVEHDKDGKLITSSSRRRLPDVPTAGVDNDKQYGEE